MNCNSDIPEVRGGCNSDIPEIRSGCDSDIPDCLGECDSLGVKRYDSDNRDVVGGPAMSTTSVNTHFAAACAMSQEVNHDSVAPSPAIEDKLKTLYSEIREKHIETTAKIRQFYSGMRTALDGWEHESLSNQALLVADWRMSVERAESRVRSSSPDAHNSADDSFLEVVRDMVRSSDFKGNARDITKIGEILKQDCGVSLRVRYGDESRPVSNDDPDEDGGNEHVSNNVVDPACHKDAFNDIL